MMHAMAGTLHLGTSGFSFDGWKHGVFYPEGLKNREMLSYYSQQLSSVEINYTFRRYPSEKTLDSWVEQTPPAFLFTVKANQPQLMADIALAFGDAFPPGADQGSGRAGPL